MGSSQRLAAVAAVSHARRYYNHTQTESTPTETSPYTLNILFASATLCGVLVMVCAACWRRAPSTDKPEDVAEYRGVYTVSADSRLNQVADVAGPPPAYDAVVEETSEGYKECHILEEVVTEPCLRCHTSQRCDSGLPSYEAAVLLKDTKL